MEDKFLISRRDFLCAIATTAGSAALSKWQSVAPSAGEIILPPPVLDGQLSLEATLTRRRSLRTFRVEPLTQAQLSQLLWAAQGITDPSGKRTAPSAGALYPLEIYAATPDGLFHYVPAGHRMEVLDRNDIRHKLYEAALRQEAVRSAAADFVIAAVYARTAQKYGARAERYAILEAGHVAQNLLLQAVALGLGGVPIGAFDDEAVQVALTLPMNHAPLYIIPIGSPK